MRILFTLVWFFLASTAFAQSNFVEGYYLIHAGDTVHTLIDDQNWDRSPRHIIVKSDINSSSEQRLTVKDIKTFSLANGDIFEAYPVKVDKTPTKFSGLVADISEITVEDTVFLRALVKGEINLYSYKDENAKEHYYLKRKGFMPEELIFQVQKITNNGVASYRKAEIYKGLLSLYLTDCEAVKLKANNTKFKMSDLIRITDEYNTCVTGVASDYVVRKESISLRFGALGGSSKSSLVFRGEHYPELEESEFSDISHNFGLSIDIVMPRSHGRYSIRNELMYKPFAAEATHTEHDYPYNGDVYTVSYTTFDMAHLGLNTMVNWDLLTGKIRPFIRVGVANNFLLTYGSYQKKETKYYSINRRQDGVPIEDIRRYSQALIGGAGLKFKNLSAEFRAETGNSISNYSSLRSIHNSFGILMSYTFF